MSVLTHDVSHTLGQSTASTDWVDASTPCRSNNPELWFAERPAEIAHAQALCGGCALRTACLTGALERREPWGVWGAELFEHGQVVARKRGPGRPRKDDDVTLRAAEVALAQRLAVFADAADDADADADADATDDADVDGSDMPGVRTGAAA